MTITAKKTLQYIVKLITPRPEVITEEAYNTQTIPLAFDLSSQQSIDLWQDFVDNSGSTITFFDFCTYKIVQLCEFMHEKFSDPTHFEKNILSSSQPYVFDNESSIQTIDKDSFEADLCILREKYPESAIAGVYNPLRSHAESKYGESSIPADIQLILSNLNAQLLGVAATKFDAILESCTFLTYYKKELDASIERVNQQKIQMKAQELEEEDSDDDVDDYCGSDDETDCYDCYEQFGEPVFIDGFLCDLKPVIFNDPVCDQVRRAGSKVYFGREIDSVTEAEAKNLRKLSMKIIKLKNSISGDGFYWIQCPENPLKLEQLIDIINNGI